MSPLTRLLDTWRGILATRRLVPILLVGTALMLAEAWFTPTLVGVAEAGFILVGFLLFGPYIWRLLFGAEQDWTVGRLVVFFFAGVTPAFLIWVRPFLGYGVSTFLSAGLNGLVVASLFWAGAWGIGRDIEMEQGIISARRRAAQLAREAEHAQLMALRAHLDPHFLFNTLNAIAEWCREDGEVAETAILRLSGLLREVMAGVRAPQWPLSRELSLLKDFWSLHQIRDPERFTVELDVPEPLPDAHLPPMLLLPLAENAIKHGPGAGHRGDLRLCIRAEGETLFITLSNPGAFTGRRVGGEGLSMVEKRISLTYGPAGRFTIAAQGDRTVAEVTIPAEVDDDAEGADRG
ncbi:MAG: histidine kinase [Myxococcota bacterium]